MHTVTGEQKCFAIIAHLSYLLAGLGFLIVPFVIMLLKKEDYFIYEHSKQALAAHLMVLAVTMIVSFLTSFIIGILFWPLVGILWIGLVFFSIMASIRVLNGNFYRYPLIQKLADVF